MLNAFPHEPPFRWFVESQSRELRHLVDLAANRGYGECSCEHHQFRCQPFLDRGEQAGKRCRHLVAARNAFADEMIRRLTTTMT